MVRSSATGSSTVTASRAEVCQGWTSKRTQRWPSRRNSCTSKAWRAEVRAPVSILAFIQGTPAPGRQTHSRHPSVTASTDVSGVTCLDSDTPPILSGDPW